MKKKIALLLAFVLCLPVFFACDLSNKIDQELYDTYLKGKSFESDGRILSFDNENCMSYSYTNLYAGDSYQYTYSILELKEEDSKVAFTVKLKSANDYSEIIDKDKEIEVFYDTTNNTIEYYTVIYEYVG